MTAAPPFSSDDHRHMERLGVAPEEAHRQLALLRDPPPFLRVLRPCGLGDGIRAIPAADQPTLIAAFDAGAAAGRIHKLVPASGAASRMFKPLQAYLDQLSSAAASGDDDPAAGSGGGECAWPPAPSEEVRRFFAEMPRLAFFDPLAAAAAARGVHLTPGRTAIEDLTPAAQRAVLTCLLDAGPDSGAPLAGSPDPDTPRADGPDPGAPGLGLAEQPKGLIPFHRYRDEVRTPFEEHLFEAADTTRDAGAVCRLHFTVSPQHEAGFRALLAGRGAALERRLGCRFAVAFSHQDRSTDTLAVDLDHRPFRLEDGQLLFRPGGHGALLGNLAEMAAAGAGVVLLKNIDNVVTDRDRPLVSRWKKLLGGLLLDLERRTIALLAALDAGDAPNDPPSAPAGSATGGAAGAIAEASRFVAEELSRPLPPDFAAAPLAEQRRQLIAALARPLRVAGVVRNSGEPGGGPFWVESPDGEVSLQIVETSQISPEADQQAALAAATHFNPVDLACAVHDRHGQPWDLDRFVDPATVFISSKSHEGRPLKALEHPGLWNGAMAGWNTVFVEVPSATFAPVKTVLDLLRREHQPEEPATP